MAKDDAGFQTERIMTPATTPADGELEDLIYTMQCAVENMRLAGDLSQSQLDARWRLAYKLQEHAKRLSATPSPGKAPEPVAWLAEHEDDSKDFVNFYEAVARQEAEESGAIRVIALYASPGKAEAEDAARLDWLAIHGAALRRDHPLDGGYWYILPATSQDGRNLTGAPRYPTVRAAIDAAIQQERDK